MKNPFIKIILLVLICFFSFNSLALVSRIEKMGVITRIEGANPQQCFFVVDGEKEEMLLRPRAPLDCKDYLNQRIKVVIKPEKLSVSGQYGTLDVLWLDEATLVSASVYKAPAH